MTIDPYLFVGIVLAVLGASFGVGVALLVGIGRRANSHISSVCDNAMKQTELNAKASADQYDRMSDQMRQSSQFSAEHWRQHGIAMQNLVDTYRAEADRSQAQSWYAFWILLRKCGISKEETDAMLAQGPWNGSIDDLPHIRHGKGKNRRRRLRTPAEEAAIARQRNMNSPLVDEDSGEG